MSLIINNIKWILIVTGVITCSMMLNFIAPSAGLSNTFGSAYPGLDHPIAQVVTRGWGFLITLVGAMLIYAAYNPPVRKFAMSVAAISKAAFIGLVLTFTGDLAKPMLAVGFDTVSIAIYLLYIFKAD